jgi:hypothetical protein
MKFRRVPLIAGLLTSSLAFAANATGSVSAAVTPKPDDNACTWFRTIDNWQRLDDRNLIVWGPNKAAYHIELSMPLSDLNSAESIAFIDGNRDGQLCGFGMDQVVVPHAPVFESATILGMTRLDDVGVRQLAAQYHVKSKRAGKSEAGEQSASNDAKAPGES